MGAAGELLYLPKPGITYALAGSVDHRLIAWQRHRLLVVIVNYRTADLTIECLRSMARESQMAGGFRVAVVDNASQDGSVEVLGRFIEETGWSGWIDLMPQPTNRGFSAGNNAVLGPALASPDPPRFFLLLNPDTVVREGAIAALLHDMEENPEVGISGSRLEDPDGSPQRSAFRFPTLWSEIDGAFRLGLLSRLLKRWEVAPPVRDAVHSTDWVAGASLMIRREVLEQVGLMDEGYFLYFEEVDLCLRARRMGWRCHYVPSSRVVHLVGRASGVTVPAPTRRRPAYWFDSRRRYFRKNHGRLYATLADLFWILGFASWRFRRRIQRKPDPDPRQLLIDFVRHTLGIRRA